MKKIKLLLVICLFFININVYASSGALKKSSIKKCPNGNFYGYHAKDNHWHLAERHSGMSSGWAAVGDPLSGDPCPGYNESVNDNSVQDAPSSNSQNNNNNSSGSSSSSSNYVVPAPVVVSKSNDTSIKKIIIDGESIEVSDHMKYQVDTKSVSIKVELNDLKAKYELSGPVTELEKEKNNEIEITVTAEDGTIKNYYLGIYRKSKVSKVTITSLMVDNSSVKFDNNSATISVSYFTDKISISYILSDIKSKLKVYSNNEEIKDINEIPVNGKKNIYKLVIVDSEDNEREYELIVEKLSLVSSIAIAGASTVVGVGAIAAVSMYISKKKKANIIIKNK